MATSASATPDLEGLGYIPPEEHTLKTMKNAKMMLDQGFTAIFSAASAKARLDVVHPQRHRRRRHSGPAHARGQPRADGHRRARRRRPAHMYRATFAIVCDGADEFRKVAREMCREGVDTLKINPSGDEFVPYRPRPPDRDDRGGGRRRVRGRESARQARGRPCAQRRRVKLACATA